MRLATGQSVNAAVTTNARATQATATPTSAPARTSRIASVDIVRGAVMVLMALDHVRDYVTNVRIQPENLAQGTAALFATRWVTHFCAPAFSLLAGLGIGLAMNRGKSASEMSRYLIVRGLWLIALDLVITPIGWRFSFDIFPMFALVLWALGLSMIVMSVLVHLPRMIVGAGAVVLISAHNLFDAVTPAAWGALAPLWHVLHVPGFAIPGTFLVGYPLIPWVAVMALGWSLADVYRWEPERRRTFLIRSGVAATILFIVVRALNGYGDPAPWSEQRSSALTVASFLNVRKYPPSLDFLLMTLGPTLVVLALVENARNRLADWLSVYGRVPMFYYVVHIFIAHLAGVALALVQGGELRRIPIITDPASLPAWYGVGLPGVYIAWFLVVLAMYPICRWFARLKQRRDDWWLRYL
jgi:uncharacterized membrane protein